MRKKLNQSKVAKQWLVAGFTGAALVAANQASAEHVVSPRHHLAENQAGAGQAATEITATEVTVIETIDPAVSKKPVATKRRVAPKQQAVHQEQPSHTFHTRGGLTVKSTRYDNVWFQLGGVMRFDQTQFMGSAEDKQQDFPSGGNVKTAEVNFKGGLGSDWSYALRFNFRTRAVDFSDAYVNYLGIADNAVLSAGRLSSPFSLDNENSTSWQPFLESSMLSVFFPRSGLGLKYGMWWHNWSFKVAAMQPRHASSSNALLNRGRDRWQFGGRLVYAPVNRPADVYHFGLGGILREVVHQSAAGTDIKALRYDVKPEATARNTATLVQLVEIDSTVAGNNTTIRGMRASMVRQYSLEAARQCGPAMVFGEYFYTHVKRPERSQTPSANPSRGSTHFHGWYLLGSYFLTGEHREYSVKDGEFSTVKPNHCYGAWELAARYSYITLVSKDINGGSEHNVTLGVNWFLNDHVRVSANYIRANIHPAVIYTPVKRKLDIIAARVQVRW